MSRVSVTRQGWDRRQPAPARYAALNDAIRPSARLCSSRRCSWQPLVTNSVGNMPRWNWDQSLETASEPSRRIRALACQRRFSGAASPTTLGLPLRGQAWPTKGDPNPLPNLDQLIPDCRRPTVGSLPFLKWPSSGELWACLSLDREWWRPYCVAQFGSSRSARSAL